MRKIEKLESTLGAIVGGVYFNLYQSYNEITLEVSSGNLVDLMTILFENEELDFKQCQDLCGVDYLTYKNQEKDDTSMRFAVVYHLLSLTHNWRIRVKCFVPSNSFPVIPSVINIWSSVNWFEREAFDLYGIIFEGHPDLRRILTDYGFIGHPFRKDFPISGHMEMKYDNEQKRVVYQAVTIEPREITPRVVREENYSGRN